LPQAEETAPKAHMHAGSEFLYVLDGGLEIRHGDQTCTLEAGDAVYFDASTPHSYQCAGKKPSGAIIVTMHQATGVQPGPLRAVSAAARPVGVK
jgi:quercetin dioxygenase-like cupin family protein